MVNNSTIVLRFDSRTKRRDRELEISDKLNGVSPKLRREFEELTDMSTLRDVQEESQFYNPFDDYVPSVKVKPARLTEIFRQMERELNESYLTSIGLTQEDMGHYST